MHEPIQRAPGPHPRFHQHPPYSLRRLYARPATLVVVLVAAVALAALAAYEHGTVLLEVDEPIQRWVVDRRTDTWTDVFAWASRLGDNRVVFPLAVALAVITWRRCHYLALAIIGAALLRSGYEFVLKDLVARPRPDLAPLADFQGYSHPSGHPMAVLSVYGLLPPVVALFGASRRVWWAVTTGVVTLAVAVAMSRVYRSAHWPLDVTASLLWGSLYLLAVETAYDAVHRRMGWHDDGLDAPAGTDGTATAHEIEAPHPEAASSGGADHRRRSG